MPDVKIFSSSGWELVHSVTVHVSDSTVTVIYDGLPLEIVFKKDDSGSSRFAGTSIGKRWVLELYNFSNPFGEGKLEPIPFAISEGRNVNITFFVQTLNAETFNRVVSLNFFKEPAK